MWCRLRSEAAILAARSGRRAAADAWTGLAHVFSVSPGNARILIRRIGFAWIALGLIGLALATFLMVDVTGQWHDADRIDAAPVQVTGTVMEVVPVKGGYAYVTSYSIGGVFHSTGLTPDDPTGTPRVGSQVCLQAAASDPGTVRNCGEHYPAGGAVQDQEFFALIAALAAAGCVVRIGTVLRDARAENRPAGRSRLAYNSTSAAAVAAAGTGTGSVAADLDQ